MNGRMADSVREPSRSVAVGGTDASRARVMRTAGGDLVLRLTDPLGRPVVIEVGQLPQSDRATFATWCEGQLSATLKEG